MNSNKEKLPGTLIILAILFSIGIALIGIFYFFKNKEEIVNSNKIELKSITDLKVSQLIEWKNERLGDAKIIFENPVLTSHFKLIFDKDKEERIKSTLISWMNSYISNYNYESIAFYDTSGNLLVTPNDEGKENSNSTKKFIKESINKKSIIFSDLYTNHKDDIDYDILIPVFDKEIIIGVLILRVDPYHFLFPFLKENTNQAKTVETILFKKQNDSVLYLNELRFSKNSPLNLSKSIKEKRLTAAMGINGIQGIVDGIDYRGKEVIASIKDVPFSDWIILTKMDKDEILEPVYFYGWISGGLVLVVIIASFFGLGLFWRNQQYAIAKNKISQEQKIRLTEKKYKDLFENVPIGLFRSTPDGNFIDVNKTLLKILGAKNKDEILNRKAGEFYYDQDARSLWAKLLSEKVEVSNYEVCIKNIDNKRLWVKNTTKAVKNENKELLYYEGAVEDITETKIVKDDLEKNEKKFRALIENSYDVISLLSKEGKVIYESPAVKTVLGYDVDELIGINAFGKVHPDDRQQITSLFNELIENPDKIVFAEFRFPDKWRNWRWLEANGKNLLNDPSVNAIVINYRDITDKKFANEQIKKLNTELEQRIKERTAELEASNKELEAFSYSVSHDLRAPLRHQIGFSELIKKNAANELSEKNLRHLNIIYDSAKKMGKLIDDLLTFSRIGRSDMNKNIVSVKKIIIEILEEIQPDVKNKKINWNIKNNFPEVFGDEILLKQAFYNIISNAVKYSSKKDRPEIEIGWQEENYNRYSFYVKDNGAGFDMKYLNKLFNVFQRLHLSEDFEGTGVGLANVKRIILRHGGEVKAEGEINNGATFYVILPKI